MKKTIIYIFFCVSVICALNACKTSLSEKAANDQSKKLYTEWISTNMDNAKDVWTKKEISNDSLLMKFDYKIFGTKPADGRSLYISLHGGGKTKPEVNDQQWKNQIRLYTPEEGVYIAPRAPWDDWNMWFKPGIDELYDQLIRLAIINEEVNPDKVYLLGYSAGGDGLYRMAPRMADRWAAASMMAGHPGEASQVNLRNLPFMVWMGEKDAAYDRNKWAATIGQRMDSLHAEDPSGYIHETHIIEGKGHWMDKVDTAAIGWMTKYQRNPYPEKIVWRQELVTLPSFYWLSVSTDEAKHGMRVDVLRSGNTIVIEKNDYTDLTIWLNDIMFDLNQPIVVTYDGKEIFNGKVKRNIENMKQSLNDRGDAKYIFPAKLTVTNNTEVE